MNGDAIAGILLSSNVLHTEWFFYLSSFVAFNTIVFVGLSIGRFIYWPRHIFIVGAGREDAFADKAQQE